MNEPCGMPQAALAGAALLVGAASVINIARVGASLYMAYAEHQPLRSTK